MATLAVQPDPAKSNWLAERQTFIGGSDVYELLNEKQYGKGCVRALAYKKSAIEPDFPEQLDDALMQRGHILEPVAAAMYEEQTGRKLRRPPADENGMPKARKHPAYPWAGVHVDRIVLSGYGDVSETGTAEIKSRGEGPYLRILRQGLFPGDLLQIQHGMFVNNHTWGPFITIGLFGGMPLKHFDVQRDEEAIEIIKRAGDKFAETVYVKRQLPEPPFASDDQRCKVCAWRATCRSEELDAAEVAAVNAAKAGKVPLAQISDPVLAQALADRQLLAAELRATEEKLSEADAVIQQELGDVPGAYVAGFGKVYRMDSRSNAHIDQKRLQTEQPEVYQQYLVPTRLTGDHFLKLYPNSK